MDGAGRLVGAGQRSVVSLREAVEVAVELGVVKVNRAIISKRISNGNPEQSSCSSHQQAAAVLWKMTAGRVEDAVRQPERLDK